MDESVLLSCWCALILVAFDGEMLFVDILFHFSDSCPSTALSFSKLNNMASSRTHWEDLTQSDFSLFDNLNRTHCAAPPPPPPLKAQGIRVRYRRSETILSAIVISNETSGMLITASPETDNYWCFYRGLVHNYQNYMGERIVITCLRTPMFVNQW